MTELIASKKCKFCSTTKLVSEFYKKKTGLYGVRAICKECQKEYDKKWPFALSPSAKNRVYDSEKEKLRDRRAQRQQYYIRTRDARIAYGLDYAKRNPEKYAEKAMYRLALKAKASPSWSDQEQIKTFYIEAQKLSQETGVKWHVDHIVPLNSKFVCGLHVSANLRVITASENISKSNSYWPDMP
jgi:hypothetical protein